MKDESFIGGLPVDKKISVPDYRDLSVLTEGDFKGVADDDAVRREMLRHYEAYEAEKTRLLQEKIDQLKEALSNEISNGRKVEILEDIDAVQAELYALDDGIPILNDVIETKNPEVALKDEKDGSVVEQGESEVDSANQLEQEPSKHWQLKRVMRDAKSNYLAKLEEEVSQRGSLQKMFGLGRKHMSPEVQESYDEFMAANKAYYQFANESGRYQKINDWLQERPGDGEPASVYGAVANRHVFKPASERLALQERQMPPRLQKLLRAIAGNPALKWGLLGSSVLATAGGSLFGMLAGKATKWGLEKTYVKRKENAHLRDEKAIINTLIAKEDIGLDELEEYYFASALAIDTARTQAMVAGVAVGAATTAGAGYVIGNEILGEGAARAVDATGSYEKLTSEDMGLVNQDIPEYPEVEVKEVALEQPSQDDLIGTTEAEPTVPVKGPESVVVTPENVTVEPTVAPEGVVEKVTTATSENVIDTPPDTSEVSPMLENEVTTPVQIEDQDIAAVDGGLDDSVTNYDRPAVDTPSVESAGTPEKLVSDKIHISKDGNLESAIPEGQILNVENEVITPVQIGDQDVAAVDGGLKDSLINPDQPATDTTPSPDSRISPEGVTEPAQSQLIESSPVETVKVTNEMFPATNEAMITTKEQILAGRVDLDTMANHEKMFGYQPKVNYDLEKIVSPLSDVATQNDGNLFHLLSEKMLEAYRGGEINLPVEVERDVVHAPYESIARLEIDNFIQHYAKEFDPGNTGFVLDVQERLDLTPREWKELGFSSGDSKVISSGDTIQMGKLIKLIVENAAEKINGRLRI